MFAFNVASIHLLLTVVVVVVSISSTRANNPPKDPQQMRAKTQWLARGNFSAVGNSQQRFTGGIAFNVAFDNDLRSDTLGGEITMVESLEGAAVVLGAQKQRKLVGTLQRCSQCAPTCHQECQCGRLCGSLRSTSPPFAQFNATVFDHGDSLDIVFSSRQNNVQTVTFYGFSGDSPAFASGAFSRQETTLGLTQYSFSAFLL